MAAVTDERANIKHVFYQGIFTSAEASYNDSVQDTATNHDEMAKIDADIALAQTAIELATSSCKSTGYHQAQEAYKDGKN